MQEYIIRILKELVEIPSISRDRAEIDWIYDVAMRELRGLPVEIRSEEYQSDSSLIITTQTTKSPTIWLYCHVDVVPGSEQVFQFRQDDQYMYGRGVLDMKFALACYLALFRELGAALSSYDLGIMLVPDEEVGGMHGVHHILSHGYSGGTVLIPDGAYNWHIEQEAKGIMIVELKSQGSSAHGSRPWEGRSAIDPLMSFIQELQDTFPPLSPETEYRHSTLTISQFHGGEAINMICPEARAVLDIRYIADDPQTKILDRMDIIKTRYPAISYQILAAGSHRVDPLDHPKTLSFIESCRSFGIDLSPTLSHGSSDARFFYERGVPSIVTCPIGDGHHTERERIDKQSLWTFYEIIKDWVMKESDIDGRFKTNE